MRISQISFRAVSLVLMATTAAFAAANADPVYRGLREAAIADTRVVENLVLRRDAGTLTLRSGTIGFTAPAMGRDTVAVFIGEGEFVFTPGTLLDRNYLKSLTGQESVREAFDRAMFCFTDETGQELRRDAKAPAADVRMADALGDFRKRLRRRSDEPRSMIEALLTGESMDNVEADLLADLYHPAQPGFFSAYLHGRKHSDLRFHVKPRGVLPALPSPEEVALINVDTGARDEGIWCLTHLQKEIEKGVANSDEDKRVVEAESYRVETAIARNDHFTGKTAIQFHAVTAGDRVVKLGIVPTLRVTRVTSAGQEVPFIQEDRHQDSSLYAVLPEAMAQGSAHDLAIEYLGDKVVTKEGGGNFSVGARESWYPSVNTFHDHARYDLIFKVPKQYTLVSVGKLAKEWTEQDAACSEWTSETPLAVAGFNYGTFKKKAIVDAKSGFGIEGYATSEAPDYLKGAGDEAAGVMSPARLMDDTMVQAQNALRIFDAWFGKSEFERIAVTQQPEFNFGQSWPTLVYLPMSAFLDATQRWSLMGIQSRFTDFIDEVTPHEVSHQWWGHMVGFSSYHDQWLSEGFATFSAGLYLQFTGKNFDAYLKYWQHARERILEKNNFGHRPNDAGPLWMGLRLRSTENPGAYNELVYRKGAYVLHMLRYLMYEPKEGDKAFIAMMHDFVSQNLNRNASTETFQRVAEKHIRPNMDLTGNGKLDWFFGEWVYGNAIPKYKFDYTVTPADGGKWLLKASLTQSEVGPGFAMPVPIYAEFDGRIARLGALRMVGNTTNDKIEVQLPQKPKRVMINYFHDVLEQ
ncbi:MAG: hypothetical protein LAP87_21630 [Acidobacteriia bacterium]|nr:hypothetical protein [Terriglobia bacterium]